MGANFDTRAVGRVTLLATTLALVLALLPIGPHLATAAPSNAAIRAKSAEIAAATKKVDEYAAQVELASEAFFEAQGRLEQTESDIAVVTARLAALESDLERQQVVLGERVADIYRGGDVDALEVIFGVRSFRAAVVAIDYLTRVSESDAQMVADIRVTRSQVASVSKELAEKRTVQVAELAQADAARTKVESTLADQRAYLDQLGGELAKLIEKERARLAAAAAAKAAAQKPVSGGRSSSGELGSGHPEVVTLARTFVGVVPYLWGGTTPDGFDCSGLALYCYRESGIYLPRTSRSQYEVGQFIPAERTDLLQPGDLLFFGYDRDPDRIHHVAIYSGGGKMIHAPYTGVMVSETYLSARSDYVGAVRP